MNEFNITLDVDKLTRAQPPVVIAQGDRNGTTIAAKVYDHGTLLTQSGLTARFKMRLPDGRYFYSKAATWTASTGTVSVTIDETQAASAVGTTTGAYFELLSGTTVVYSTSRFTVRVLRSATDMSAQADSYDDRVEEIIAAMDVAVEAVEDAQEAAASANSAAASATSAATNANTARDNANSAASAANSAASTATSAAGTANNAASNANGAAQTANAAATNANDAAASANDAAERAEAIAEYSVPLMSPTTRGGAKLGSGLSMDGDVLSVALEAESDGTIAGPIVELTAKGHAEQATTTGKNLNGYVYSGTISGMAFSYDGSGKVTLNGTTTVNLYAPTGGVAYDSGFMSLLPAGTYTLSASALPDGVSVTAVRKDGGSLALVTSAPVSFTLTEDTYVCARINVTSGTTLSNATVCMQIEAGSTATSYEPYTGGAPSPSPDYPQEIQTVTGHEVTGKTGRFVDLVVKQGDTTLSTTPIPLPSRGWAGALPDGTADALTLDGAGKVVWEENTTIATKSDTSKYSDWDTPAGYTVSFVPPNQTIELANIMCNKLINDNPWYIARCISIDMAGRIRVSFETSDGFAAAIPFDYLYPLATPVTEDMGYVDLPEIPEGATLSVPELDALNVRYVVDDAAVTLARQWYERARSEYEDRIAALEDAVAEIMAGS